MRQTKLSAIVSLSIPTLGVLWVSFACGSRQEANADRAREIFSDAESLRLLYESEASRQALAAYGSALELWVGVDDTANAARACQRRGLVYENTGDLQKAEDSYRRALQLATDSNQSELASTLLSDLGLVQAMAGYPHAAGEACSRALSSAREAGDPRAEAKALDCLGEIEYHQGNLQAAIELQLRAQPLWESVSDRQGRAQNLLYLGTIYSDLSELELADTHLQKALGLWQELGDRRGRALTLVALGRLRDRQGDYQLALNTYSAAMELVEPMSDPVWQASLLGGIGTVYEQMAEYPDALAYWEQALALYSRANLPTAVVDAILSLGEIEFASGNFNRALEHFDAALVVSEDLDDQRLASYALTYIGHTHQTLGDLEKALSYYERSLEIQRTVGDRRLEAYTVGDLGVAHLEAGDHDLAAEYFGRALELSRAAGDRLGEATGLYHLAHAARVRGDPHTATTYLELALQVAESLRAGVESHTLRTAYFASIQHYYELDIDALMQLHRQRPGEDFDTRAFEMSERARARSLLDILAEASVDLRHGVEPELLDRERDLKRRLDALAAQQLHLTSVDADTGEVRGEAAEIRELTARYDQLQAEIRSKSPRFAALTQPAPLSLRGVQERVLDERTIVLEYSLGEERSFLWAVERGRLTSIELPSKAEIEEASLQLYRLLTARQSTPDESVREYRQRVKAADAHYQEVATRLANMLIEPIAGRLAGKRIVVVSDGAMQYIPFAALPLPGGGEEFVPMIAEHEIVNLPSVSALAILRQETRGREEPPGSVVVLADPIFERDDPRMRGIQNPRVEPRRASNAELRDMGVPGSNGYPRLVATRQEAEAILAVAPTSSGLQALDFAASRSLAMSGKLRDYRIIHFATHGIVNNENPGLSGVLLSMFDEDGTSKNGFLRLHDIYNLDLPAELVVLSACSSALGKPVDGEGLVGIVRGFMYAGAKRVVASLWKVDDEATGDLMQLFYQEMFGQHRTPSAALRQAQLAMWEDSDWQAPFFWAAFVLQGEWQ